MDAAPPRGATPHMHPSALLLLLALPAAVAGAHHFSACHNNHSVSPHVYAAYARKDGAARPSTDTLLAWCAADERCAASYYLTERLGDASVENRRAAFAYLTARWSGDAAQSTAELFERELCSHRTLDDLTRRLWLLELRAHAYENARSRCGSNERFIFSAATLEGHCVCLGNRNCDANAHAATADAALSRRMSAEMHAGADDVLVDEQWSTVEVAILLTCALVALMIVAQIVELLVSVRAYEAERRASSRLGKHR